MDEADYEPLLSLAEQRDYDSLMRRLSRASKTQNARALRTTLSKQVARFAVGVCRFAGDNVRFIRELAFTITNFLRFPLHTELEEALLLFSDIEQPSLTDDSVRKKFHRARRELALYVAK